MSSRKKGGQPKPEKTTLVFNGKEIPEGSALHTAFTRLAGLGEREIPAAAALVEMLVSSAVSSKRLVQMQAQLDRIEGRIIELVKGPAKTFEPEKTPQAAASRPKKGKKPSAAARESVALELAELEETVEERQKRMAKMEMDEKYKKIALIKKQEMLKAQKGEEAAEPDTAPKAGEIEKKTAKKKPRKRRKPAKKETPAGTTAAAQEAE